MTAIARAAPTGRAARTRQTLLNAGRQLFADRAFDAVAIDDIVARAGVAKGTFYNHFDDKDALLEAIVSDIRGAIERQIGAVNVDVADPCVRIVRAVSVYVTRAIDHPIEGQILLRNDPRGSASAPLNDGLRADLSAGLGAGRLVVPSIDAGLLFVIGITHGLLLAAVRGRAPEHVLITTQQTCGMMLRGFGLTQEEAEPIAFQAVAEIGRMGSDLRPGGA